MVVYKCFVAAFFCATPFNMWFMLSLATISEHLCWLNSVTPRTDNAYFSIHKSLPFSGILSSLEDSGKGSIALACAIFQNGSENSSKMKIKKVKRQREFSEHF